MLNSCHLPCFENLSERENLTQNRTPAIPVMQALGADDLDLQFGDGPPVGSSQGQVELQGHANPTQSGGRAFAYAGSALEQSRPRAKSILVEQLPKSVVQQPAAQGRPVDAPRTAGELAASPAEQGVVVQPAMPAPGAIVFEGSGLEDVSPSVCGAWWCLSMLPRD